MLHGERVATAAPAATGSWRGRDGFVAETAVQLDRIQATIAGLEREAARSRQALAEVLEEAARTRQFQSFEESLKNSRDYKINDLQRGLRDLKARLDAIGGDRGSFARLTYKSFAAVDQRLAELGRLQARVEFAELAARRNGTMFYITVALAVTVIATHLFF